MKVVSHSDDLIRALNNPDWELVRIGLEAGLPAICIETGHDFSLCRSV